MMNRLIATLAAAAAQGRGVLVGYLPAGYPSDTAYHEELQAAVAAGLDVFEMGLPGPTPLDGPVIQQAAALAMEHVPDVPSALRISRQALPSDLPILALAYRHHLDALGASGLLSTLRDGGADALLVPDLPMSEQLELAGQTRSAGLEPVLFLHLQEELAVLQAALDANPELHPVIYLQSADTKTGGEFRSTKVAERMDELTAAIGCGAAHVLVGFGIRSEDDVETVMAAGAEGAIIGTALVKAAALGVDAVTQLIAEAAAGLPRPSNPISTSTGAQASVVGSGGTAS